MRGHPYRPSRSLRIHYISRAARLCLLARFAPRPAPRAAWRIVMPPFSPCIPLLVPLCVASFLRFAHRAVWRAARPRLPLRLPAPCLLLVSHRFPIVMALASYRLPPRSSLLPAHRPADRVEGRGDAIVLLTVMRGGGSGCVRFLSRSGRLCLLGVRFRSRLKTLLGNLLKTCLGKLLKTFTGNLLKTVKHIHLPICPATPFCGLRRFVSPPIALSFSLVCILS